MARPIRPDQERGWDRETEGPGERLRHAGLRLVGVGVRGQQRAPRIGQYAEGAALRRGPRDPVHRAYLNDVIPSKQRATVLSFDSLLGSAGGVVFQPILGRSADLGGYGASMLWSGVITAFAAPFVLLSRGQKSPADTAREVTADAAQGGEPATDAATDATTPPTV